MTRNTGVLVVYSQRARREKGMTTNAITYSRVSTLEQAQSGYSLRQQTEALRAYCEAEGWRVVAEIVDGGHSGADLVRPGLDSLRDMVAQGGVQVVIAQDRDRFAREPAYLYLLKQELAAHGCLMRTLNGRGDDSPEGELTEGIIGQIAKFERAKLTERSRRAGRRRPGRARCSGARERHTASGTTSRARRWWSTRVRWRPWRGCSAWRRTASGRRR